MWNYISDSGQKFNVFTCRDDILPKIQNPEEVEIKLLLVREKIEEINYFYKLLEYFKTTQNQIIDSIYEIQEL